MEKQRNPMPRKLAVPHIRTKRVREPLPFGPGLNAHKLVAKTAIEMAEEVFELYAQDNTWYKKMRADGAVTEKQARKVFVERVAPRLLEDARKTLVSMLGQPDDVVSEHMKQEIYEAICLDNDLRAKRFVSADMATVPGYLH